MTSFLPDLTEPGSLQSPDDIRTGIRHQTDTSTGAMIGGATSGVLG